MVTYRAPGVYVTEVPSAIKPIAGVGTSTAGIIGVMADRPEEEMPQRPDGSHYPQVEAGKAVAIRSWEAFTRHFGGFRDVAAEAPAAPPAGEENGEETEAEADVEKEEADDSEEPSGDASENPPEESAAAAAGDETVAATADNYLAHAVYGFFNNGGTSCYVIRVSNAAGITDALEQFETVDEIALLLAPLPPNTSGDARNSVHAALVAHAAKMKDRFAILDSARDITGDNLTKSEDDSGIRRPSANPDGYGAFYFPWIEVADPVGPAGSTIFVPPSGHVAGIYARSDAQRGVHKAPANEIIMGAVGVRYPVSRFVQEDLNPVGINCIRSFGGTIKIWGARTLASDPQGDPEWKYVNVRRLVNFVRESIEEGTQWVVFEPNNADLWAAIRRNVTSFLTTVWETGALQGLTPEEAFYVKCDADLNGPEEREQGIVKVEIGIAIVRPAEFVIFRLSQWAGGQ